MLLSLHTPLNGTNINLEQLATNEELAGRHQQVVYQNPSHVLYAMGMLQESKPLTSYGKIHALRRDLGKVARGNAVIVQAGLCVEDSDNKTMEDIDAYTTGLTSLMHSLSDTARQGTGMQTVVLGRMAGQLAKPRSSMYEEGSNILTYRGPMIHGIDENDRNPQPGRLVNAYMFSKNVIEMMDKKKDRKTIYASHEALSLEYEHGLMQEEGNVRYTSSAPFVWIGNRTREVNGPHVQFARDIANPVGLKCGTDLSPEQLLELIDTINPNQIPGKLTLIFRMGARNLGKLDPLLQAVKQRQDSTIVVVDAMHGNGDVDEATKKKTRYVENIKHEVGGFVKACRKNDIHPGGLHLEASPNNVTECFGDGVYSLHPNYQTLCDPCLNPHQATQVVREFNHYFNQASGKQYRVS